jgi:serine protease AprX
MSQRRSISIQVFLLWLLVLRVGILGHAQIFLQPAPDPQALAKIDPLLQPRLAQSTGHSRVIVRGTEAVSIGEVAALVQQLGGTLGRELPILNAQVADVPNLSLLVLAQSASVQRIALDRLILGTLDWTGTTIGATAARQTFGYDGSGIGVAVIDSGVTSWHDDLSGLLPNSQRVDKFVDFVQGSTMPYDDYGHGTHVSGIIAGNGVDSSGALSGIAPRAQLVVLKVLDGSGQGRISDVIAAIEYAINHKQQFQIRIINLSLATGVSESYDTDVLTQAAKRAVERGLVVVASAGNVGRDTRGHPLSSGVTAPGNAPWVLTVGAFSHQGTLDRSDDTVAAFSSRGPTLFDRAAKPDLVAPGVGLVSLSDPNSLFYTSRANYLRSGTVATTYLPYLSLTGTSQAAPVVAGTVALMLQANPALTPNAVKAILQYTAQESAEYPALTQGAGFLNARGAIELARFLAAPAAQPYPDATGWSQQILWKNHRVRGGRLTADAAAWATAVTWGDVTTPGGQNVAWGVICHPAADCQIGSGSWTVWGTSCSDANCGTVQWGDAPADNVVWGSTCGGADCQGTSWSASTGGSDAEVWGASDSEGVVWGSTDSDAVVWGSSCEDPNCES